MSSKKGKAGAAKGGKKGSKAKEPEPENETEIPEDWEKLLNGALDLCRVLGAGAAGAGGRGGRGGGRARGIGRAGAGRRARQDDDDDEDDDGDEGDEGEEELLQELVDDCQNAASDCLADFSAETRSRFAGVFGELLEQGVTSGEAQQPRKQKLVHKAVLGVLQALIALADDGVKAPPDAKDPEAASGTAAYFSLIEVVNNSMAQIDKRLFDANISDFIALVTRAAGSAAAPMKLREHAVLSMCAVIQGHVDTILKHKQLDAVIDLGMLLTRDSTDLSLSSSDSNATNLGTTLLDTLTGIVGQVPKAALVVGQNILDRCLKALGSDDQFVAKGALIALAVLPENAEEFLEAQDLGKLYQTVSAQFDAKQELVRAAARMTVAEFATHMPKFVAPHLPALAKKMLHTAADTKEQEMVKAKSVLLVLNLIEGWPREDLVAVSKGMVEAMLKLIADTYATAKAPKGDAECVRYPCALIRGIIRTLSPDRLDHLKPLVPALNTALQGVLTLPDAKTLEAFATAVPKDDDMSYTARAEAVQCYGNVFRLMKRDDVKAAAGKILPLLWGCYEFPCHRTREATNEAVGEFATAVGEDFTAHLDKWFHYVNRALDPSYSIKAEDGEHTQSQLALSETSSTILALKEVVKATATGFKPQVNALFEKLVSIVQFAAKETAELLGALPASMPIDKPWVKGVVSPLSDEIKEVFEQAMDLLMDIIEKTQDEDVAAAALDSIGKIADAYGSAIVPDEFLEKVVQVVGQVMNSEAEAGEHEHGSDCDHGDEGEDEDGDEDDEPAHKGKGKGKAGAKADKKSDKKADGKDDANSLANIFGNMAVDANAPKFEFNFAFNLNPDANAAAGGAAAAPAAGGFGDGSVFQFVPPAETSAAAAPEASKAPAAAAAAPQVAAAAAAPAAAPAAAAEKPKEQEKSKEKEAEADADGEDDDSDDEEEEPAGLISAIDLVGDLARVKGPAWFVSFRDFFPNLLRWAQSHKNKRVRLHCFGTLADVADSLDDRFSTYIAECFPAVLSALSPLPPIDGKRVREDDLSLLRNVSFFTGVLALKGGENAAPFADKALAALLPILSIKLKRDGRDADPLWEDKAALRDNATSAVAKIILTHPKLIPMERVLPAFLSALPLEVDLEEGNFVYSSVIKMIHTFPKAFPALIEQSYAQILEVFHTVLTADVSATSAAGPSQPQPQPQLKDTLKAFMAKTCASLLAATNPDAAKLNAILAQWPAAKSKAFHAAIAAASHGGSAADAKDDSKKQ